MIIIPQYYTPLVKPEIEEVMGKLKIYSVVPKVVTPKQQFTINYIKVAPYSESEVDQHEVQEYWIVLKGQGIVICNEQEYHMKPLDVFYFCPYVKHQIKNTTKETILICSIFW